MCFHEGLPQYTLFEVLTYDTLMELVLKLAVKTVSSSIFLGNSTS